jgi:hypothetical protein
MHSNCTSSSIELLTMLVQPFKFCKSPLENYSNFRNAHTQPTHTHIFYMFIHNYNDNVDVVDNDP